MLCSQVITISLLLIMVRIAVIVMVWQDNHKAASALVGVKKKTTNLLVLTYLSIIAMQTGEKLKILSLTGKNRE